MENVKLLLVDDETEFREGIAQALARRRFEVVATESGARALQLLQDASFDIMVLDLRTEGMSGIETLAKLREFNEMLPVVILTGHGQLDDALAGIRLGIIDFLHKPVQVDELAERIRALLRGGPSAPLRERRIAEVMAPTSGYRRVYADQPLRDLVATLEQSLFKSPADGRFAPGLRTIVVYDREETFLGCVRAGEVLDALIPAALRDSPYSSYLTGMFLAQCKLLSERKVKDILGEPVTVEVDAPLIEAVHRIVTHRVVSLPVLQAGKLVGILREKDLLVEASHCMGGG
jgi:DNA-binding response OmpR family regulator